MKKLLLISSLFGAAGCSFAGEPQGWGFVQSVGGIEVGTPTKTDGFWVLPVRSDVSGLQAITVKPTTLNSGLACAGIKASIKSASIYLTVITSAASPSSSSQCPSAQLGALSPGNYSVFYLGPNEKPVQLRVVAIGA